MNTEVEELRKFAKGTITKARLEKLRTALAGATSLFQRLEPKPGDEDAGEEFEDAQSDLETALEELESACDELDAAEEKEERQNAQEQVSGALDDALSHFDRILPVAVLGNPDDMPLLAVMGVKIG